MPGGPPATALRAHDPVVDLLRAAALVVVVFGHWLMQGLYVDDRGGLHRDGLLGLAPWTHPLTWVLQVMPIVFAVGGYANARSWRRAQEMGQNYGSWLHVRVLRLTRPLIPLLLLWSVVPPLASLAGAGEGWVGIASRASLVPTWFLAVYLVVMAASPPMLAAWDRWGLASVVCGVLLAAAVDLVSLATPLASVGVLNVVLVWMTVHQLGIGWEAGSLNRVAPVLAIAGGAGLVLLVALGPYATAMVGVSGFGTDNTNPPRVTLLFLGLMQVGGAVMARPFLVRLSNRPAVRGTALALGSRLMTVYLWHLTVLGMVVGVAMSLGGVGLHARPDTADWWWQRPLWLMVLTLGTGLVVGALGWFEHVPTAVDGRQRPLPALVAVAWTTGGLGLLASGALLTGSGTRWYLPLLVLAAPLLLGRRASTTRSGLHRNGHMSAPLGTFDPVDDNSSEGTINV